MVVHCDGRLFVAWCPAFHSCLFPTLACLLASSSEPRSAFFFSFLFLFRLPGRCRALKAPSRPKQPAEAKNQKHRSRHPQETSKQPEESSQALLPTHAHTHTRTHTDRHTDKQTHRQTHRQTQRLQTGPVHFQHHTPAPRREQGTAETSQASNPQQPKQTAQTVPGQNSARPTKSAGSIIFQQVSKNKRSRPQP